MGRDLLAEYNDTPRNIGIDLLAEEPQESLSSAAAMALPRIGEDVFNKGYEFLQQIPEYYQSAKTEVPAMLNPFIFDPIGRGKQLLAGIAEAGQGLANLPRGVAEYASNRLNLIPKEWSENIWTPGDNTQAINNIFGEPSRPGEKFVRGVGRNILAEIPALKAASLVNPLKFTNKNLAKDVINARNKNIKNYTNYYQKLFKDAENKGFNDALYNVEIDIPTLNKFSPAKSIQGVLDFNKNPTLQNAHAAKSDLLRIQRDLNKLPTLRSAERQQLKAATDAIDSIKQNMFKNAEGKIDADMLKKYENIQSGYANDVVPYKNKAINEYLRGESSAEEMVNSLSKRAFAAKRGKHHPRIGIKSKIKRHPYLTAGGVGTALGAAGVNYLREK